MRHSAFEWLRKANSVDGAAFLGNSISVEKYETYELKLTGCEDKLIRWKSKDKSVATVKDGVVCANKKGKTTVTAEIDGEKISCEVVITDSGFVPTITWKESSDIFRVKKGETYQLSPQLTYNGNTYTDVTYSFRTVKGLAETDDKGVISENELGNDVICVEAKWRDTVIETSVQAAVVDVTTAIEVGDKEFLIYVNGDVEGAAVIRDGKAYAKKVGTSEGEWYKEGQFNRTAVSNATGTWVKKEFTLANIPKNADDTIQAPFLMNTIGGLYVRNVKVNFEKDYTAPIQGEDYTFFIQSAVDGVNTVEWDSTVGAFHLVNRSTSQGDDRGFIFDMDYIKALVTKVNAEYITYEYMWDGQIYTGESTDASIYSGNYPGWWGTHSSVTFDKTAASDTWRTMKIKIADIPEGKAPFIMNAMGGLYVRNITVKERGAKFRMDVRADKKWDSMKNLKLRIYNCDTTGAIGSLGADTYKEYEITAQNTASQTIEIDLDWLLGADGKFKGFSFMTDGYGIWAGSAEASESFSIYINNLRTVDKNGTEQAILIADHADDFVFTQGDATGLTGGNGSGAIVVNDTNIYISTAFMYRVCKVELRTSIELK